MTSRAAYRFCAVLALAIPLLTSCATSTSTISSTNSGVSSHGLMGEPATPVSLDNPHARHLLEQFAPNAVRSVQGSALLQISEPGQSERLQMQFTGIAGKNHIRLKTSVGIPAAEIYSDPDSLILLNLADSYAEIVPRGVGQDRAATHDSADPSTAALAARQPWTVPATANLLDILHPSVSPDEVQSLTRNKDIWKLTLRSGEVWTLRGKWQEDWQEDSQRDGQGDNKGDSQGIQPLNQHAEPFTLVRRDSLAGTLGTIADSIEYLGTVDVEGQILPRRVSILNETRQSRILVQIRSLQINGLERPDGQDGQNGQDGPDGQNAPFEILRPEIPADFTVIRPT